MIAVAITFGSFNIHKRDLQSRVTRVQKRQVSLNIRTESLGSQYHRNAIHLQRFSNSYQAIVKPKTNFLLLNSISYIPGCPQASPECWDYRKITATPDLHGAKDHTCEETTL